MRVTLVRPPQLLAPLDDAGPITPPIGAAYLAASLRAAGHEPRIVDAVGEAPGRATPLFGGRVLGIGMGSEEAARMAAAAPVELLGVSCLFSQDWPEVRRLLRLLREQLPGVPIVAGGEHASAVPEQVLADSPEVDWCVRGEGEETLVAIANALEAGEDPGLLPGVVSREHGRMCARPRIKAIDGIAEPAWDLVPVARYLDGGYGFGVDRGRSMPILASRGCPYQCTFCSNPAMWTTRWDAREPAAVVGEMARYHREYDASNFDFYDLTAIVRRDWIIEFCDEIQRQKLRVTWQLPSGTRSEALDDEVTRRMREAGCRNVTYAPESGSAVALKRIKKKCDLQALSRSASAAVRNGLNVKLNMIVGFPGETRREVWSSLGYLARMGAAGIHDASVAIFSPYPGCELFDQLRESGSIGELDDEFYFGLAAYKNLAGARSYSPLGPRELTLYRLLGMALFYGTQYFLRPWRMASLLSNLISGRQESRLDKSLQDLLERLRARRRARRDQSLATGG